MVARRAHNPKVVGSSPASATKRKKSNSKELLFFFVYSQNLVENISLMENTKRISVHFDNTDIILVDPCYFIKDDGTWEEYCDDFAENRSLEKMGCSKGICLYVGDVSPSVLVNPYDGMVYDGQICTDSHLLGCFRLENVLAHNPEYAEDMEKYPDSFCIIKGFTGDVVFEIKDEQYYDEMLPMTTVIGIGSPAFHSAFIDYDGDGEPKLHFSDCTME